jgi:hypothetical protein
MKPLSETLTILITIAEEIMRRPAQQTVTSAPPAFAALAVQIRYAHERPAEAVRTTRAGIVMCEAIEAFLAEGGDRWQMIIGATLPVLRLEAFLAFRNERDLATPEHGR